MRSGSAGVFPGRGSEPSVLGLQEAQQGVPVGVPIGHVLAEQPVGMAAPSAEAISDAAATAAGPSDSADPARGADPVDEARQPDPLP